MATKGSKKRVREKVLLGVLVVVLGIYVLWNFVFTGSPSKPRTGTAPATATVPSTSKAGAAPAAENKPPSQAASTPQERLQLLLFNQTPLDFHLIASSKGGDAAVGARGNIFEYHKDPLPPPPIPLPPPPITINYLQPQTAIAGTPRPFTLTVVGKPLPADAQIWVNGNPRPTKRVNDSTLSTEIRSTEYSTQTTLAVDVKSQADPIKMVSNHASFVVAAAPDPPFKYIGRIGEIGVLEMNGTKEVTRVVKGGTIQGVWRIESITNDGVDVIHTQYEIRKRVTMQDKPR